jgi:hypothetical protein
MPAGPTKPNKTGKHTANDSVMTPVSTAKFIIDYFWPSGTILDPCRGNGAFYDQYPEHCLPSWCEINPDCVQHYAEGAQPRDFFDHYFHVDWIMTNPPFSIFNHFLKHALGLAKNVVLLIPANKVFKATGLLNIVEESGHELRTILEMGGGSHHGFNFGFPMAAVHWAKIPESRHMRQKTAIQFHRISPRVVKNYARLCSQCENWNDEEAWCVEKLVPDQKGCGGFHKWE